MAKHVDSLDGQFRIGLTDSKTDLPYGIVALLVDQHKAAHPILAIYHFRFHMQR